MSNIDKHALTDEAISKAFAGTNFGRDDFKNILAETVIDAAAGWRCGYTATTICTQLGLLTPKGCASALGLRFISEHVQRETKRLKDELEAKETENERMARELLNRSGEIEGLRQRIAELEAREINMPPYSFFDFKQGSPFKSGAYCHIDSVNKELSKYGIKIIAAAGKGEAS